MDNITIEDIKNIISQIEFKIWDLDTEYIVDANQALAYEDCINMLKELINKK